MDLSENFGKLKQGLMKGCGIVGIPNDMVFAGAPWNNQICTQKDGIVVS